MSRMVVRTAEDVVGLLPSQQEFAPAMVDAFGADQQIDLLILANGFEDRSLGVANWLRNEGTGIPVRRAVVLKHGTNPEDNEARAPELFAALAAIGAEISTIDAGLSESDFLQRLSSAFLPDILSRVVFDISGASGQLIMRTLRSLFDISRGGHPVDLSVAYSEALEYSPTIASSGVVPAFNLDYDASDEICEFAFPAQHTDILPDGAVVICGFNAIRVRSALNAIDSGLSAGHPHPRVKFVIGVPTREDYQWRAEAMSRVHQIGEGSGASVVRVPSDDYRRLIRVLESHYGEKLYRERLTVVPFGSKWHTVASAFFCEMRPDVRVLMVSPTSYGAASYSTGVGRMRLLRLGDCRTLSSELRRVDEVAVTLE